MGGGANQRVFRGGGMDIFWNNTLFLSNEVIVSSTLLVLRIHIRTDEATKIHTLKSIRYWLFFQSSSRRQDRASYFRLNVKIFAVPYVG